MADEKISNVSKLRESLSAPTPPNGLSAPLQSLWWAAKDDWDKAHSIVQGDEGAQAALVHAYLHRVEGDLANASYWYRRAGRDISIATLEAEWHDIAAALLDSGG